MRIIILALLFLSTNPISAQSISELKKRFDTYLNFNGSLSPMVKFSDNSVALIYGNKAEFTIYADEHSTFANLLTVLDPKDFTPIYIWKKNKHLSQNQLDSLNKIVTPAGILKRNKGIAGKKIALDPGHFAGNMEVARIEQKFIHFVPTLLNKLKDTIRFNEGKLTFETAEILKHKLEEQGAIVMLTRPQQNYTAFQITYSDWLDNRKKIVLDSLLKANVIIAARHATLMKMKKEKLFWEFFRDFELKERARLVNQFKPDLTIIIHYNVDEKNTDWINPTEKNYTMAFIGGGMTADNFSKQVNKTHFLRLLLTDQINQSEKIASLTVNQFSKDMSIQIAQKNDADYLKNSCLKTPSNGVFCRNLALCRTINSPLVYGECLYQDNINECIALSKEDYEIYGKKLPKRIYEAANCYYEAINIYFNQK